MNYKTLYGAIIRKDTRLYFLADSNEDRDTMCCIYKRKMYIYQFKDKNNYNQIIYEVLVEGLAQLHKYKMHRKYKQLIKTKMYKFKSKEIKNIIDNIDDQYIAEVNLD